MTNAATTITATYRIVTPMFCAGADQRSAELRLPSFKGALRFWWRSLMWGKVTDHNELRKQEAELFGASDQKTGQSKVRLRFADRQLGAFKPIGEIFENGRLAGAHYLGYGVMEAYASRPKGTQAGQLTRSMIEGGMFTVECRFGRFATEDLVDQVKRALILLGTVGGMGSKSRKGFGSLSVVDVKVGNDDCVIAQPPEERLKACLGETTIHDGIPSWSAWSREARVVVAKSTAKRAVELLDDVGREEVHFRSWGRNGIVLNNPSERNFPVDHSLSKGQHRSRGYPFRIVFGLPHNYGRGEAHSVQPERHDRRASPLFVHIDQTHEKEAPSAVLVFLPSQLLPRGERIKAFGDVVLVETDEVIWFPIHAFLDRIVSGGQRPATRPGYENLPQENEWWRKKTSIDAQEVNLG